MDQDKQETTNRVRPVKVDVVEVVQPGLPNDLLLSFTEEDQEVIDAIERVVTDETMTLDEIWLISGNTRVGRIVNTDTN